MRRPRDFSAELKALEHKAQNLKNRKVQPLGERIISTGADALSVDELAGALIVLAETKAAGRSEAWAKRGAAFFQGRTRRSARVAPVLIEKHGRGVVVVISVEEYERLSLLAGDLTRDKEKIGEISKRG